MVTIERTSEQRQKLGTRLVRKAVAGLDENSLEVQEDGGPALSLTVRQFVAEAASKIVTQLQSRLKDIKLTAGARMDGGAHLLADFAPTDKRISLRIYPDGKHAWAAKTDRAGSVPGCELQSAADVTQLLDWLTQE